MPVWAYLIFKEKNSRMIQKHILFISSEPVVPEKMPLASIYVLDQARIIKPLVEKVGFFSIAYLPTSRLLMGAKYYQFNDTNIDGIIYYTDVKKKALPINFISQKTQYKSSVRRGIMLFEKYIYKHGLPDFIHAHNSFFAGIVAIAIKRKYNVPVIVTEHSSHLYDALNEHEIQWIQEVYEESDEFISVSKGLAERVKLYLGSITQKKGIKIIPNALDPIFEEQRAIAPRQAFYTFVNVGNLVEVKNQKLLLHAFANVFAGNVQVKLLIIGDGPLKRTLKKIASDLNLDQQVEFTGYLNKASVKEILYKADAFVLSSKFETYGIAVMEALACGLPVISTPCKGPEMMISHDNGVILEDHDINSLGKVMHSFWKDEYSWNKELIKINCEQTFGHAAFIKQIEEIYKSY